MLELSSGHAAVVGSVGHMVSGFWRMTGFGGVSRIMSLQLEFGGVGVGGSPGREAIESRGKGREQDSM